MKKEWFALSGPQWGLVCSVLSSLAFALMNICVGKLTSFFPFSELAFFRGALGGLLLLPRVWSRLPSLWSPSFWVYWVRCIAGALSVSCFFWTLSQTGLGVAMALNLVSVVFTLVLAFLFFRERIARKEWLGIALILGATASFSLPRVHGVSALVIAVGLLGAFFTSIAYLALRKVAQQVSGDLIVFGFLFMMTGVSLFFFNEAWVCPPHWFSALALLGMSLLGLIAQFLLTLSFLYLPTVLASTLGLLSLVFGVFLQALVEGFWPSWGLLLADSVIILGVLLLKREK